MLALPFLQLEEATAAQDVAATILAFFCALPSPFMPSQITQTCQRSLPSKALASQLLGEAMSPAEWAIFRHMTGDCFVVDDLTAELCFSNCDRERSFAQVSSAIWWV